MLLLQCVVARMAAASVLSPLLDRPAYSIPASAIIGGKQAAGKKLYVNCATGSDAAAGTSAVTALKTLPKAVSAGASWIEISGGMCPLAAPVRILSPLVLHGDGKTAISGGKAIEGWQTSSLHPGGKVMVADVAGFPLKEIKSLRVGAVSLSRSRWPKLVGEGLTTPNFLFAMSWSSGSAAADRSRSMHQLGIDPTKLPANANLSAVAGNAFVHVLGCVEKDVNSQLTKVMTIGGTHAKPTAGILFRNTFTTNQRYYFENVDWELVIYFDFHYN